MSTSKRANDSPSQSDLEGYKLEHDFLKHLTTLSTGCVVLMAGFLEKLFIQPKWKILVGISFTCFGLSIIGALLVQASVILQVHGNLSMSRKAYAYGCVSYSLTFLGFFFGISSLIMFALINFYG